MTILLSDWAKGLKAAPMPAQAGQVTSYRATYTVPTGIVEGSIIDLFVLPPGCKPVDAIFDTDDLDSGSPAIVWDVGLMNGKPGDQYSTGTTERTCGDELFDGITTSQAAVGVIHSTEKDGHRIAPANAYRSFGAKLVTDAATAVAGEIGLTVFYVADTE